MKFKGLHAFVAGGPCGDGAWLRQFSNQAGLINIAQFWLSHPERFASAVIRDTSAFGGEIRSANLTNVERSSGLPPGSKLNSVCRWSDLKSFAIGNTGSWFLLLPGLVLGLGVYRVITLSQASRPDLPRAALSTLAVATLIELTIAVGFDAIETNCHFIVMHLIMDLSILLVAGHVFGGYSHKGTVGDGDAAG